MNPETHRPQIEQALRLLESHAFDVKPLWLDLAARTSRWEGGTPGEDDVRYVLPTWPPDTATHFVAGQPQVMGVSVLWPGFSYTLTLGQRSILRDTYGLTPTQTVTCAWVESWPGTQHPRTLRLVSDIHVDPRNRRHVLVSCVIKDVGRFFKDAAELDTADRAERRFGLAESSLTLGRLFTLESEERWAIEDLTGVKVVSKVEVTGVSPDRFVVMCQKTGNVAKVPKAEFFKLVDEYIALHKTSSTRVKRSRSDKAVTSLLEVMKELELG